MKEISFILIFFLFISVGYAQIDLLDSSLFYEERCGLIARDSLQAQRIQTVFKHVRNASDYSNKRRAKLLLLKKESQLCAFGQPRVLPDGGVLISQNWLELLLDGVSEEIGDARVAFILAHELSHLARNDHWHHQVLSMLDHKTASDGMLSILKRILRCCSAFPVASLADESFMRDVLKTRELRADSEAIIIMSIAGYNPFLLVSEEVSNFFDYYASLLTNRLAYGASHPEAKSRQYFIKAQIEATLQQAGFFHFGTRFMQLGRYEPAILMLKRMSQWYPSSEVLGNLGLSYYYSALQKIQHCSAERSFPFELPTIIDNRLAAFQAVRQQESPCPADEEIDDLYEEAIGHLSKAVSLNPNRVSMRINHSSALIRRGLYSAALAALEPLLNAEPFHPLALNNKSIALHFLGIQEGFEGTTKAIEILESLSHQNPSASILKNLGILKSWVTKNNGKRALLEQKEWGDSIKTNPLLGKLTASPSLDKKETFYKLKSPIKLGLEEKLGNPQLMNLKPWTTFTMGKFRGTFYVSEKLKVYASLRSNYMREVAIVEVSLQNKIAQDVWEKTQGQPKRMVKNFSSETWIYEDFAADLVNNFVTNLIFFRTF